MKLKDAPDIGIGTIIQGVVILGAIGLLIWRLIEGDTFADAQTYVLGIIAAAVAVALGANRAWQDVRDKDQKVELAKQPSGGDGVGQLNEDVMVPDDGGA